MPTEDINPRSKYIDALPIEEIINLMNYENLLVIKTITMRSILYDPEEALST